jgi:hypothetical protein
VASVYSTRFIATTSVASDPTYVVPAGYRAIVRDVLVYPGVAGTGFQALLFLVGPGVVMWSAATPGSDVSMQFEGRIIFEEGETMGLQTNYTGVMHGYVGGYLLTLP